VESAFRGGKTAGADMAEPQVNNGVRKPGQRSTPGCLGDVTVSLPDTNQANEFEPQKGIILIVDSDLQLRDSIVGALSRRGYRNFVVAGNGKDGLDAVYSYKPDVIICDCSSLHISGTEMMSIMQENPPLNRIPVLFLGEGGVHTDSVRREMMDSVSVISKPVDEEMLIQLVDGHIQRQMERSHILSRSHEDELTGLENSRNIMRFLYDRAMLRSYNALSLVILDMDGMREFNEAYGYRAGDFLLASVGKTIGRIIRSYDKAGRIGGDSFLLVLPETAMSDARILAEKLRIAIGEINPCPGCSRMHASFGISSLTDNEAQIAKTLSMDSLRPLFDVTDGKKADWAHIEKMKREIANLLVTMANDSLSSAKLSECDICGHTASRYDEFSGGRCPRCGSGDITSGKNRIVSYHSV
jgi:two-component system chemotaxis response regulator CheY